MGGPGFGAPGYEGPGELQFPAGLAIDEARGYLYVADTGHHRVVRYVLSEEMQVLGQGLTVRARDVKEMNGDCGSSKWIPFMTFRCE